MERGTSTNRAGDRPQDRRSVRVWLGASAAALLALLLGPGLPAGVLLLLIPGHLIVRNEGRLAAALGAFGAGVLVFMRVRSGEAWIGALEAGALLGGLAGLALALRPQREQLAAARRQSRTDALTGALTRLAFETEARAIVESTALQGGDVMLALVDCDRFKELNDRHGHLFGDLVLRKLVQVLRAHIPDGVVGRNGGDEFVVVAARDIRADLRRAGLAFSDATFVLGARATISVGIARSGGAIRDYAAMLDDADMDMYSRKRAAAAVPA